MNKLFLYVLAFSLLVVQASCGQRRPGMSREEAAAELEAQAAKQEALRQQAAASLDTFATDYRPPAGIKYQPTIIRTGAKVLNVPAALKNVRVLKPNEFGTLTFRPTGYEGHGLGLNLLPVDDGWLLTDYEAVCLLDKEMKLRKVLFKNDVEISEMKMGDGQTGYGIRNIRASTRWATILPPASFADSMQGRRLKQTTVFAMNMPWPLCRGMFWWKQPNRGPPKACPASCPLARRRAMPLASRPAAG